MQGRRVGGHKMGEVGRYGWPGMAWSAGRYYTALSRGEHNQHVRGSAPACTYTLKQIGTNASHTPQTKIAVKLSNLLQWTTQHPTPRHHYHYHYH